MLTDDGRQTMDDNGRQPIKIGHPSSNSGDLTSAGPFSQFQPNLAQSILR